MANKKSSTIFLMNKKGKGISPLITSVFLISLFGLAIFMFTVGMIGKNNPNSQVINNTVMTTAYTSLNNSLSGIQALANTQVNTTQNEKKASSVSVFLILDSILTVPWTFLNLVFTLIQIEGAFIFGNILGNSFKTVYSVLTGILDIIIIFLFYKFVRQGETER